MQEVNYEKSTPEVQKLYQRLKDAHASVEDIFKKNLSSLVYTNGLDIQVNSHMSKLTGMSAHVNDATDIILEVAKNTADVAEIVREQQENLTVTISEIANDSVYAKIEEGQNELTSIKNLSDDTMDMSKQTVLDMRLTSDFSELRKTIRSLLK